MKRVLQPLACLLLLALGVGCGSPAAIPPLTVTVPAVPASAFDVHDGAVRKFGRLFYWFGTSYGCGFVWLQPGSPFCGFRSFSSPDLVHWSDRGLLFGVGADWDLRCGGGIGGCFRPKVVYNPTTRLYVLWWNQPGAYNGNAFGVATSKSPSGPFQLTQTSPCCGGASNGDEDVWTHGGTAYLAEKMNDGSTTGHIVVAQLDSTYRQATGRRTTIDFAGRLVEAPSLFERKGTYYLVISDPACGYCSGTGTSYLTAPSPLGPWTFRGRISDNSCGGQPAAITSLGGDQYLYQVDRWNTKPNEAAADQWWTVLTFDGDAIAPINCSRTSFQVVIDS